MTRSSPIDFMPSRASAMTGSLGARITRHLHLAAAAASIAAGAANAAVVHWSNMNLVIPNTIDGLYINVETRATGSAGSLVAGWDINPYSATSLTWFNATGTGMLRNPGATTGSAGNLPIGTIVGGVGVTNNGFATSFGSGAVTVGSAPGNWQLNAVNIFGFRFVGASGGTHYGYGFFQIGSSISGADRMITDIFYEDVPGVSITVGFTPGCPMAYRDVDGDGFGAAASGVIATCIPIQGYVSNNTDCNDSNAAINPNTTWYRDTDGDGVGAAVNGTIVQCTQPAGYVLAAGDNCPNIANANQADVNNNGLGDVCEFARGDLNLDGVVNASDVPLFFNAWGSAGPLGDLNFDGVVNSADFTILLNNWGTTP